MQSYTDTLSELSEDVPCRAPAKLAELVALLRESKREHHHCGDSWYCCPLCLHEDHGRRGMRQDDNGTCNCGASAWNARVDEALKGL